MREIMIHSVINLAPMTFSVVQMISGSLVFSAVLIGMISCGTCWNRLCRFGKNDSDRLRPSSQPELIKRQRKSNVEREGERRQSEFAPNKQQQETIGRIFDRPFSKRSYLNIIPPVPTDARGALKLLLESIICENHMCDQLCTRAGSK